MRRMSTTRQFDALRPLTRIAPVGGTGSTLSSFAYAWNALDQRTRMALAAGSYWVYEPLTVASWELGKVFVLKGIRVIAFCGSWWRAG